MLLPSNDAEDQGDNVRSPFFVSLTVIIGSYDDQTVFVCAQFTDSIVFI